MHRTVFATICLALLCAVPAMISAQYTDEWYTEGNFEPLRRIKLTVRNTLTVTRENCPVVVKREQLSYQNTAQRTITVVDPSLPSNPEPTKEQLRLLSGYLIRKEKGGHFIEYQMDDIDKDGFWDELFFMTNLKPREEKTIYLYIGKSERGLYKHKTHANIGYYGRHMVAFWESEFMGWKLWYPMSVDLHGKRQPMLTAYPEYQTNLSGYYMPFELGTDIMTVSSTFGNGGIGLFEVPADSDSISRPSYDYNTGKGPLEAPRYAFDVVLNGPLRSMIRVKTMNWYTGSGYYELEQYYTAYSSKSYATCDVRFTRFLAPHNDVAFCCGIRRIMTEYKSENRGGTAISYGKDVTIRIPDEDIGDEGLVLDFEGIAIVVKDEYRPEYMNIDTHGGNHVFKVPVTMDKSFEYMILGGWSEGTVNRTEKDFREYVLKASMEYNYPPEVTAGKMEDKK
ncbi:DUF4861 family protein [Candidatus Latescibacterota bacterium]